MADDDGICGRAATLENRHGIVRERAEMPGDALRQKLCRAIVEGIVHRVGLAVDQHADASARAAHPTRGALQQRGRFSVGEGAFPSGGFVKPALRTTQQSGVVQQHHRDRRASRQRIGDAVCRKRAVQPDIDTDPGPMAQNNRMGVPARQRGGQHGLRAGAGKQQQPVCSRRAVCLQQARTAGRQQRDRIAVAAGVLSPVRARPDKVAGPGGVRLKWHVGHLKAEVRIECRSERSCSSGDAAQSAEQPGQPRGGHRQPRKSTRRNKGSTRYP